MTIFRVHKREKFTQVDNKVIDDVRLSPAALGVLVYFLRHGDGWEARLYDLVKRFKKLTVCRTAMKELEKYGYAVKQKVRDEKGRFKGWKTDIHEKPVNRPLPTSENLNSVSPRKQRPRSEKPTSENLTYNSNTDLSNTDLNNNNIIFSNLSSTTEILPDGSLAQMKKNKKIKKIIHLPHEFAVTDYHCAIAKQEGLSNPHDVIEAFRDYFQTTGATSLTKSDWDEAFCLWLRSANKERAEKIGGNHGSSSQRSTHQCPRERKHKHVNPITYQPADQYASKATEAV